MKSALLIFSGLLLAMVTSAQCPFLHYPDAYLFPVPGPEKYYQDNQQKKDKEKQPGIRYAFNVGSSYFTPGRSGGFYSYFAPGVRYAVSRRFHFSGGVLFQYTNEAQGLFPGPGESFPSNHSVQVLFYGQGTYLLRPNLSLSGTVVKNLDQSQKYPSFYKPYPIVPDSYSLRLNYRISNSISFGAEFRYSEPSYYMGFPYRSFHGYGFPYYPY